MISNVTREILRLQDIQRTVLGAHTQLARDVAALDAALAGMSPNEQMGELRRKIEMRTVGLGWTEFETEVGLFERREAPERSSRICVRTREKKRLAHIFNCRPLDGR